MPPKTLPSGYYDSTAQYLDNNGTTFPSGEVMIAMCQAMRLGNASASYADKARKLITTFKSKVLSRYPTKDRSNLEVIITSGASESNNTFFRSIAEMYRPSAATHSPSHLPHFISSSTEHGTSLECLQRLKDLNYLTYDLVEPQSDGQIHLDDIIPLIKKQTVAISIMNANNETGAINDVDKIARYCRRVKPPIIFHSDIVQTFGKFRVTAPLHASSISFHKLYGPQGIGTLILDKSLIRQGFHAQIAGAQNNGLRGGTENLPAIAGALTAMNLTFHNRAVKNAHLKKCITSMLQVLKKHFTQDDFDNYQGKSDHYRGPDHDWHFIVLGPKSQSFSERNPNTLLLSIIKPKDQPHFCNVKLKKLLLKNNTFVSIGSACHTSRQSSSHVLKAMKAPFIVRCGVIRISVSDHTTLKECRDFIKLLISLILKQK